MIAGGSVQLPLRGVRVLDLSRVLAGPWCTMLLADAGATVVKVERPVLGDDTRSWGPPFVAREDTGRSSHLSSSDGNSRNRLSTYFLSVNRGKQSVAIDLKQKRGREICHRLATEWADVLVENFKTGTMDQFGLSYDNLVEGNPGLVYCSVTGFGPTGPLANKPGYDVIASGMYGLMSITGDEASPAKVGVASTDVLTGTLAQSGILAALYQRQTTGLGQKVDVSLMETQLASLVNIASSSLNAADGQPSPKRWGTAHESIVPYQAFECKPTGDDQEQQYVMVGAGNDSQFVQLCEALERSDLATDPRFTTNGDRVQHRDILLRILQEIFRSKSRDDWLELLDGNGFPLGPLRTVPEAFACEQAQHRGMVETMDHPVVGKIRLPRTPITFSSSSSSTSASVSGPSLSSSSPPPSSSSSSMISPPPMLGEHTAHVLHEILGMDAGEIARLEKDQVVECYRDS